MQVDYHAKYLKYKQKYLDLKEEMMGSGEFHSSIATHDVKVKDASSKECKSSITWKGAGLANVMKGPATVVCQKYKDLKDKNKRDIYKDDLAVHAARCKECGIKL
jgi:hypothetical protein